MKLTSAGFIGYWIVLILLATSCHDSSTQKSDDSVLNKQQIEDAVIEANKHAVELESQQIADYIQRHKWDVKESGTGLRYWIYNKGAGRAVKKGSIVSMKYRVELLNGTEIYSSTKTGIKSFVVGQGNVESGLEEAMLLLHGGDRVWLIIPSYLAWGLLGDQNRIPPKATVIYDLEIIGIK